jgi:hypothetical protein
MKNEHRYDIRIGDDAWIKWVDFDRSRAVNIDALMAPLEKLWQQLETECVHECCGIDAFSLSPESIRRATVELGGLQVATTLESVRRQVMQIDADGFVSDRLNNYFHRDVLQQLFNHILRTVLDAGDL